MKIIFKIGSYLGVFIIGAYTASTIKFDTPVEMWRWAATIVATLLMILLASGDDYENS